MCLTRVERRLVEAYERTCRAYAEFRFVRAWDYQVLASPGDAPPRLSRTCQTVMDMEEVGEYRRLLEAFLIAEDRLRDHVIDHGPVEAAGVVYRLDGDRRITRRRDPRWGKATTSSSH